MWGDSDIVPTGTLKEFDRTGHLPELTAPVLFVTGEFDEARPETVAQYQALVDGSRFEVLPDAGHMVYLDQPELFNTVLAEFFREVESQH